MAAGGVPPPRFCAPDPAAAPLSPLLATRHAVGRERAARARPPPPIKPTPPPSLNSHMSNVPEFWGRDSPYHGGTEFLGTPANHLDVSLKEGGGGG